MIYCIELILSKNMDYNNMNDEEIVQKIKSGEIAYVGDHFINHNHNFNMTKAVAIANRNVGKDKVIVNKEIFKNLFGYDQISVHGVGFDMDAYYVIGYASYLMNKTKSLKVNIDIVEYLNALNVKNISNKARYKKAIMESIVDIYNTSFEIKLNGRNYGRKIFAGYDYSDSDDIISIYFDPAFAALQSKDKILISGTLSEYKSIKKDTPIAVLDVLRTNNYSRDSNEIYYADLKSGVVSGGKTVSRVNENFKRAFEHLVCNGYAEYCYLKELPNRKVVVKFKLTKKGMMQSVDSAHIAKPVIPTPLAAPVTTAFEYESVANAIETTFDSQGVNHEYLAHLEEQAAREAVEETSFMIKVNGSDMWEEFDPEKFYGTEFNGGDNDICDEGLPF